MLTDENPSNLTYFVRLGDQIITDFSKISWLGQAHQFPDKKGLHVNV